MGKTTIKNSINEVLLWTNTSGSTASQTISLDLTPYSEIRFDYYDHGLAMIHTCYLQKGLNNALIYGCTTQSWARYITVNDTGVTLGQGYKYGGYNGTSSTADNNVCKPHRIYGVSK